MNKVGINYQCSCPVYWIMKSRRVRWPHKYTSSIFYRTCYMLQFPFDKFDFLELNRY